MRISYAGFIYNNKEINAVVKALKDRKSLLGDKTRLFEKNVSKLFGKKFGVMVNSGSSANLLALEILKLPKGSEIITPVLTFSTTLAPIVQKELVPVLLDVKHGTYLMDINQIEDNITSKTKALFIPSLLGNVPDFKHLYKLAQKHNLILIEDSCDTLGATINNRPTGCYSDISTTSFYGSHIISAAGGGGMICVNDPKYANELKVLRGWGRMSSVLNESEDIKKRFNFKIDDLSYDAKFVFGAIGYNFLPLEISSAFGLEQLKKLNKFSTIRNNNFKRLLRYFSEFEKWFILPKQNKEVKTNWLAFPLTIKNSAPFSRMEIVTYLERNDIQTRPIFTGNVLRQHGFKDIKCRVSKNGYPVADDIMKNGFVIGCHHGLEKQHLDYLISFLEKFLSKYK